jgi:hypothetical protein
LFLLNIRNIGIKIQNFFAIFALKGGMGFHRNVLQINELGGVAPEVVPLGRIREIRMLINRGSARPDLPAGMPSSARTFKIRPYPADGLPARATGFC